MQDSEYVLRAELKGHEEDVRAVCVGDLGIITGSRDKTLKIWKEADNGFQADTTLIGHSSFVTSLASFSAGTLAEIPGKGIVSGSRDLSVIVWAEGNSAPAARLTGHKYQISCVAVAAPDTIISSSHDGTVRVYSGPRFERVTVLTGHEGAVQAVLVLPTGEILTGGNDAMIKLWRQDRCEHTFKGHTDTVRGLALLSDFGVVSASHDMTLKVWDFEGRIVADLTGHKAIVYSAATSGSGLIASASEDNTAKIWRPDGACLATIPHPGCVWDVAFLQDNDLVTGCSDYVARVWTAEIGRQAPAEVQDAYRAALAPVQPEASTSGAAGLPEGLQLEDQLALSQPGNKDGQIKVIKEGGGGMAYSWSQAQARWEQVGQVIGGQDAGDMEVGSSTIDGVRYDHVISVEIDDRAQPLRLGINRGDNPYEVADRFIATYDLPVSYREQIVDYIVQNTRGAVTIPASPSFNPDPFTGGNSYAPGDTSVPQPLPTPTSSVTGGGVDPFTGSGAYKLGMSRSSSAAGGHIPATTMLVFDNLPNVAAVANKVRSLAQSLAAEADTVSMALTDQEAVSGGTLDRLLSSASAAPSGSAAPKEDELTLLSKLLRWPASALFPALDITRLLILHEQSAAALAASAGPLALSPSETLGAALGAACAEPQLAANQQTGLRLLCNAFKSPSLRSWLRQQSGAILDGFSPALAAPQKAVRGAAAAFLLNLATSSCSEDLELDVQAQALSAIASLLSAGPAGDEDTLYRAAVALGTLVSGAERREARQIALDLDLVTPLQKLCTAKTTRTAEAARETLALLGR